MFDETLNEREFELINIVGGELAASQRDLSRRMNLSLGMTNMLLKRLAAKGYIRIRQLDKRKMEYLLTPKGLAEKLRKSVRYTRKTIQSIGLIKERLGEVLGDLYRDGHRNYFVLGGSDLACLIDVVLKEGDFAEHRVCHIKEMPGEDVDGIILVCEEGERNEPFNRQNRINLIEQLAQRII